MRALRFHELTIAGIRRETPDAIAIRFAVPDNLVDAYAFQPGQYLTLRSAINNEDVRRSYSICTSPDEGLEVGIKQVEGGVFSSFAHGLRPGDRLQIMVPQGRFTVDPNAHQNLLLVAAGSGITPVLSIAKAVLRHHGDSQVTLLYANRNSQSVMFKDQLITLKDRFTTRLTVHHITSREAQDVPFFEGRLDADKINSFAERGLIDVARYDGAYICGPEPMTKAVSKALQALGLPASAIHFELFTPATAPAFRKAIEHIATEAPSAMATIRLDGTEKQIALGADETVLEAAGRAGLDMPYSCAGGMCSTCRCKVVSGDTTMDANYALENWELKAGYTLACQTRIRSKDAVLDFDAA